jgi:hypothetical protein
VALVKFFFEAFMTVGKTPTASLLPRTRGYKGMYMGVKEKGGYTVYRL